MVIYILHWRQTQHTPCLHFANPRLTGTYHHVRLCCSFLTTPTFLQVSHPQHLALISGTDLTQKMDFQNHLCWPLNLETNAQELAGLTGAVECLSWAVVWSAWCSPQDWMLSSSESANRIPSLQIADLESLAWPWEALCAGCLVVTVNAKNVCAASRSYFISSASLWGSVMKHNRTVETGHLQVLIEWKSRKEQNRE